MSSIIRSVPELPFADLLSRAFDITPVEVHATWSGGSCSLRLPSGAMCVILPPVDDERECIINVRFPDRTIESLDALRGRQRDAEVIERWATLVTACVEHGIIKHDVTSVMEIVGRVGIDGSDEDFVRAIGDYVNEEQVASSETSIEVFIDLAISLRELHVMATLSTAMPIVHVELPAVDACPHAEARL